MTEITPAKRDETDIAGIRSVRHNWGWLLALGVVWIGLGALAIIMPLTAALALEVLLGVLFAVGGIAQVVQAVKCRGWNGFLLHAAGGGLALVLAAFLLLYPVQGILTLALLLSVFFIVSGALRIIAALQHKLFLARGWVLLSGVAAVVIGVLIWLGWPGSAVWVLGTLVGIEMMLAGWSMVMLARAARLSRPQDQEIGGIRSAPAHQGQS